MGTGQFAAVLPTLFYPLHRIKENKGIGLSDLFKISNPREIIWLLAHCNHMGILANMRIDGQDLSHYDSVMKKAPPFRLQNAKNEWVDLNSFSGPLLLVFYPGDFTSVCTKQLCSYQDSLGSLLGFGIQLLGISPDSPESHEKFAQEFQLKFPLLSDPNKETFQAYGVKSKLLFGMVSRAIFVLDQNKNIVYEKVESTAITHRKAEELLKILQQLKSEKKI